MKALIKIKFPETARDAAVIFLDQILVAIKAGQLIVSKPEYQPALDAIRTNAAVALSDAKTEPPLTYADFYRNLDGLTALAVAGATPLTRITKDERDTAFVKRIVATYLSIAAKNGAHGPGQ